MREIKFRGYSTEGKWIYLNVGNPSSEFIEEWKVWVEEIVKKGRGKWQFTGLLDKSGKEIYENDVVKINDDQDGDRLYKVIFEKGSYYGECMLTPNPSRTPDKILLCDLDYFTHQSKEVIGNIYEHKHLLD